MPSGFADSFWSADYATGLNVLFDKLQQGCIENQQVIQVAKLRAEAEDAYGQRLLAIPAAANRPGGFGRDDGASVRKAYDGLVKEMEEAGKSHRKVADNIRQLVIEPFSAWCQAHEDRVTGSFDDLQLNIKAHERQAEAVKKLRTQYFNKCRLVEDLEEETKFLTPASPKGSGDSSSTPNAPSAPQIKLPEPEDPESEEPLELGDLYYHPNEVRKILAHMMDVIPMSEYKVAILGTYDHVSTGDKITEFIQQNLQATSVSHAERIGQDFVHHGFLRLVGSVGSTFANSAKMHYQWRDKAFTMAEVSPKPAEPKKLERIATLNAVDFTVDSPSTAVGDFFGSLLSNPRPGETQGDRLRREVREADERYKAAVKKLDLMRCALEESIMAHFKFMEQCELDRLRAIKAVILDFSGAISNVIPCIQSSVDNMLLYQETVQPLGDLRYMLDNYRTGSFVPKVVTYENYYNSADEQTFGLDLEVRARADKKRVPLIITGILTYLDHHYPDLEGDEARRGIWLVDVPLESTHHLRNAINNGKAVPKEVLANYEIPVVASVLKLYLLELPDSLVSCTKYEIIKTVYTTHGSEGDDRARLAVIQNTLGSLPLTNIATLDAITTHFTRLIELTSADEAFISNLAHSLANCILRPRFESPLTQHERHSYRLVRDLFAHRESIFGELKRASTLNSGRARAVSTDESQRRAHVEARNRAVISTARSRQSSPAPGARHRRDVSSDMSATRFPVAPSSPPSSSATGSPSTRYRPQSLEVPGGLPLKHLNEQLQQHYNQQGVTLEDQARITTEPEQIPDGEAGLQKSNSLSRSGAASGGRFKKPGASAGGSGLARTAHANAKRDSMGSDVGMIEGYPGYYGSSSAGSTGSRGVQLSDAPMDD
ncbi:hypothetical protein BDZ91DRAFT_729393 [Kalaharituber pfeilii]|nr:hypothetical protein BDZ91DRAFT_729393 [Kalaharituber pfeilii]